MNCAPSYVLHAVAALELVACLVAYWLGRKHGCEDAEK